MHFWKKTCYSPNGEHVCVCNPVVQGSLFPIICVFVQGGNPVSIAGCPTKRAMPQLMWSLINSMYLQAGPLWQQDWEKSWPPEAARLEGCGRFTGHVRTCHQCKCM